MNSPVARFAFSVALLASPLCALAQFNPPPVDRTGNLTLLTGPTLTSPAGKRTLTPQGWIISSGTPAGTPAVQLTSFDGVRVQSVSIEQLTDSDLRAAQERLNQAEARLEQARIERDLALARKKALEENLRHGPPPFEVKPLPLPTRLAPQNSAGSK